MSGHSKWSKIKHKKEANDITRGKIFTQLSRAITIAVVEGGGITDPIHNVKLRLSIEKARTNDMPKDNIARAIEKASGSEAASLRQVRYEAFGPHGVMLIILAASNNSNRTIAQIRNILERHNGKMGVLGSVMHLFQECGVVVFPKAENTQDAIFHFVELAQASDIDEDDEHYIVYIPYEKLGHISEFLTGMKPSVQEHFFRPLTPITVNEKQGSGVHSLVEELENFEDVVQVFSNYTSTL